MERIEHKIHVAVILTLALVCLILLQVVAAAATYYVDATSGNDSNPGTELQPWKTVQKAASTMNAGDTCIVLSGNYAGTVSITKSGSTGNPIVYQANAGAVLNGSFNINADFVRIAGFEVVGGYIFVSENSEYCEILDNYVHDRDPSNYPGPTCGMRICGSYCTVRGNRIIRAVHAGIDLKGQNNLIENNDIGYTLPNPADLSWQNADGMRFFGTGHTIRGNYIHDLTLIEAEGATYHIDCFQTWGPASDIVFEQNYYSQAVPTNIMRIEAMDGTTVKNLTFKNNIFVSRYLVAYGPVAIFDGVIENITFVHNTFVHAEGIGSGAFCLSNITGIVVKNNIFYNFCDATHNYITLYSGSSGIIGYNCIYNSNGVYPSKGGYSNDLWGVDPKFISFEGLSFSLQPNSPCIDKGETLSNVTNDYAGNPRPQGAGYDIGAYEYMQSNQPPVADAGPDQTVVDSDRNGSEQVTLDGSGSSDPDGNIVSFVWSEGGSQIATGVKPTVTLPLGTHIITLTVTDNGGLTDTDTVTITVSSPANQPPVADAGPDQAVIDNDNNGSEQVTLDGSGSSDPDGNIVSFVWSEGGSQIATGVKPTVTLPLGTHIITLTVTDNGGLTDTDMVNIKVLKGHEKFGRLPTGCYNNVINPAKGERATIMIELEERGYIRIDLYNMKGEKIRELANEEKSAGTYPYYWDGKDNSGNIVGCGLYFVHIQAGDYKKTKKIVVVK